MLIPFLLLFNEEGKRNRSQKRKKMMKLTEFHLLESTMCLYFIAGLSKSIRDINW